jgi:thioredoxin-related protein
MKPVVDGLETELGDKLKIVRVNVQGEVGRELAPVYSIEFAPTFIFFDAGGNEIWRSVGDLNTDQVRASLTQ